MKYIRWTYDSKRRVWAGGCLASLAILAIVGATRNGDGQTATEPAAGNAGGAANTPLVAQGSEDDAKAYYKAAATDLGFPNPDQFVDTHVLQDLLSYCGYGGLLAKDIESVGTDALGNFDVLKTKVSNSADFIQHFGDTPPADDPVRQIVSVAYFAPKITTVPFSGKLGWRRVVRFKVRPGSPAAGKSLSSLYVLFNHFAAPTADPFKYPESASVNNQAILVRGAPQTDEPPLYWFVYNGSVAPSPPDPAFVPGKLLLALNASFDAAEQPSVKPYFVPTACAQCHGDRTVPDSMAGGGPNPLLFKRAKLNMLDSDQWYDRVQPNDDFHALPADKVLYDGDDSFAAIRKLNEEVLDQNKVVDPNTPASQRPAYQRRAVETWLALHPADLAPKSVLERGLAPRQPGDKIWSATAQPGETITAAEKAELLGLLSRYCYRCHSSVKYHVFDKQMVFARAAGMIERLDLANLAAGRMPQDRELETATKNRLQELLEKVAAE